MAKLLICDKDGTLVKPKSGGDFVQSPEDQELLPGVKEQIRRYHSEGWRIVVVSNQGGCAWQPAIPEKVQVRQYLRTESGSELGKVISFWSSDRRIVDVIASGGAEASYKLGTGGKLQFRWKAEKEAIAEMRYLMQLLPEIDCCYFCPDFEGRYCYQVFSNNATTGKFDFDSVSETFPHGEFASICRFRKPDPGMIQIATDWRLYRKIPRNGYDRILFVGDQECDLLAAQSAGIKFQWAHEFFGGAE